MTAVEKLVQQINRALTEKPDRVTLERLAREYTELCQATSRRLEQCEAMLTAGDHYQVIQLAETTPPVLDQVAFLSFVQADDWLKLCRTSNLPVPVAFPERALARVNELYANGITAGHPLYRDYRTAMVERNDERALGILRAIIKLNSADESAKAEFQRLEQKVRDQRIASLDQLLQKRDVPAVLAALTGLESVFREASLTGPVIEQARAMRREQERQQAHRQCEELIMGLVDLQQARNWQKALESTQTVEKLCSQHGIELEPTLTKQFTVARNWATGIKAQADQEQRYRETLQQFRSLVMAPPTRGHGSIRTALKGELTALTAKRSELEMAGRPLAGELATLATQREARLRQQLAEADRRYLWLVAGGVGMGLVMLASGFFWWNYEQKVAATVAELQQLMTDHNVSGVRQRLDDIRRAAEVNPPPRRVQEMLATLDAYIVQEEQQQADATAKIKGLVAYYNGALTNAPTAEFASKVQEAYAAFSNVAKEFQSGMELQLDLSKQQLKSRQVVENVYAENAIRQRRQQLETLRTEVESSLAQALASTNRWRTIQSRLQAISQNLGQGTALVQTNDVEYQTWLTGFKAKLEPLQVELANLDTASRDLRQAQTAEAYLTALAQLQSTHFSELPEFRAASKVLATSNTLADVTRALLMPDDLEGWTAFKANPEADFFPTEEIEQTEATILLALRDNDNLRNIFRYELPSAVNSKPEIPLNYFYTRGQALPGSLVGLKMRFTANAFVPEAGSLQVAFSKTNFFWEAKETAVGEPPGKLAPESRVFAILALPDLVDPQSSKFRKSILGVLDALRAAREINPVFRAYVHQQLLDLMDVHRVAWGSAWVPALKEHRKQLKDLDAGELQSADWMLPERVNQWQGKLANFYRSATPLPYLKLARYNRSLVQNAAGAGVGYAGFIDGTGKAVLTDDGMKATEFWGLTAADLKLGCLLRKGRLQNEPEYVQPALSMTPLFFLKADRQQLRRAALKSAGISESEIAAVDVLSPLFK